MTWCTRCESFQFFFFHLHGTLTLLPQVDYWLKLFTVVVVVVHRRLLYFVSNINSINQNVVEETVAKRTDLNPPCIFKNRFKSVAWPLLKKKKKKMTKYISPCIIIHIGLYITISIFYIYIFFKSSPVQNC